MKIALTLSIALLFASSPTVFGQELKQLENHLRPKFERQVLTLREFATSNRLRFNADGHPAMTTGVGSWTLYGMIEVERVTLRPDTVALRAIRMNVECDNYKQYLMLVRTKRHVSVEIELPSGSRDANAIEAALRKPFLSESERLLDFVSEVWKSYLRRNPDRNRPGGCGVKNFKFDSRDLRSELGPESAEIFDVGNDITRPDFIEDVVEKFYKQGTLRPFSGRIILAGVIRTDGTVGHLWIMQPVGRGLDEEAIEAVQQRKYRPAERNGTPVAVFRTMTFAFFD